MKIDEATDICKVLLFKKFGPVDNPVSRRMWIRLISEFSTEAVSGFYSKEYIESEFQKLLDATPSVQEPSKVFRRGALQRHHDFYICLYTKSDGVLEQGDTQRYNIAIERENIGLVKPFVPPT